MEPVNENNLICFSYCYIKEKKTSQEQNLSILLLQQYFKTYFVCVHACACVQAPWHTRRGVQGWPLRWGPHRGFWESNSCHQE